MSLHYYNDIYPNISISKAILTATKSNLSKFEDYIDSAITSLKKRGEISIRWMEVDSGVEVKLTPLYTAIRADVPTQIRINWNPNYLVMNSFNNEAIIFPEEWIFCINSGKPVRVEDINSDIAICAGNLSVADGMLLMAGRNGAAYHDGDVWRLIFNDQKMKENIKS